MDLKVRRRVARKVLTDIHDQVGEIEQQVQAEKSASRFLLPGLVLLVFLLILLWLEPGFVRGLSALF